MFSYYKRNKDIVLLDVIQDMHVDVKHDGHLILSRYKQVMRHSILMKYQLRQVLLLLRKTRVEKLKEVQI